MQAPRSPKVKPRRSPLTSSPASSDQRSVDETTDKRLLRGVRSRKLVLARAVDIASLESLEGLSFGQLATETGMSKAGIQALFETKQTLQKDTFAYALDMFRDFVVRPADCFTFPNQTSLHAGAGEPLAPAGQPDRSRHRRGP